MSKHAYLILAHNDIQLLQTLVSRLDDVRNDIFVHWDVKSGAPLQIEAHFSRLFVLDERVKVNWAGFSIVEAEYLLFKKAFTYGPYSYYHLLSGTDLPIKSQDYIHDVCSQLDGTEFIAFANAAQEELDFRAQHYFLFSERFKGASILQRTARKAFIKAQDIVHYRRTVVPVRKGSQWCSVTQSFVAYLLEQESFVRKTFSHTFCPDELFIQTVCANSKFMQRIKSAVSEFDGNMRFIKWVDGELLPIEDSDYSNMLASDKWFARKFSSTNESLIKKTALLIE